LPVAGYLPNDANPMLARRVDVSDGVSYYLEPSKNGLCVLSSDNLVHACFDAAQAVRPQDFGVTVCEHGLPPSQYLVSGVLPDDTQDVEVKWSNGVVAPITVAGNMLLLTGERASPQRPVSVSYRNGATQTAASISLPPDLATTSCGP
jgi:hypothetical protein